MGADALVDEVFNLVRACLTSGGQDALPVGFFCLRY
jgi:hypothetical protein